MATKQETIDRIDTGLGTVINLLIALQQGSTVLKQAQDEGWTDDDARWAAENAKVDDAIKTAMDRLT